MANISLIHILLTEETRHMIGENEFRMMRKQAFIINT
ncbi:MAG: NAD(P)-dependent oxidoreductase [Nitrososphaeria archaeon]